MPEGEERAKLAEVIRRWNNNRLDLFEISQPDEHLEFHGVQRFYFEDRGGGNVATKCLRVCSDSSTRHVVEALAEKFRPDMKTLMTGYSLYEIHGDKERKLALDERPLVVQLNWTADDGEGRFVLREDEERLEVPLKPSACFPLSSRRLTSVAFSTREKEKGGLIRSFKRTLSRKEKNKEKHKNGSTEKRLNNNNNGVCVSRNTKHQRPAAEAAFLSAVLHYTNSSTVHFPLSPAYVLYAAGRFALQRHRRRGSPLCCHGVALTASKMVAATSERQQAGAGALAFWMANSSELLNFLKRDKDLGALTRKSQLDLSHLVHRAYRYREPLPCTARPADPEISKMVLNTLMNAMSLLRRCRVNAALTIQLFSQLFHFISVWLFNRLTGPEAGARRGLRSHYWGAALRQRLTAIEAWAERQGLELAADCHLGHIVQATTLLTMNKYSMQDVKAIQNTCFKLNSLQLQTLLSGYLYAANEPHITPDLIDAVVTAAKASADNLIRSEGRDIQLEESLDLHLPFLLPEGGYSCDTAAHGEPDVVTITLNKPLNSVMGVSIVAAKGAGQENLGIYIKSIVKGGPAEMNGRLTAGDQLLRVDGQSVVGLSQERAAAIMMQTGPVVTLQVAKFGASYRGLEALLSDPTPGGTSHTKPNGKAFMLYRDVDPGPSERLQGGSERSKDEATQRNRRLYRSNPDMNTGIPPEDGDEPVDPVVRAEDTTAVSSVDLCADTVHREYLTLPIPASQDKNASESRRPQRTLNVSLRPLEGRYSPQRTFMRHALSQEDLCVDRGRPLVDGRQNLWEQKEQRAKQTLSHYSSFPIRSSVSTHDVLLSEYCSPAPPRQGQQQHGRRASGAGVWRTPFSQHPTPTPSNPPMRIDIPVTVAARAHAGPPPPALTTFQSQTPQARGHDPVYACPTTAAGKRPQSWFPPQQQGAATHRGHGGQAAKPQVSITPTKHVSFLEPPAKPRDPRGRADPWRREAHEKMEKQQRLRAVELLQQEVMELRGKASRSEEENGRLRRLSLEWQFQKRLQEVQRRGGDEEEEEEEEEEEDLDMMVTLQQVKTHKGKRISAGNVDTELKEFEKQAETQKDFLFYWTVNISMSWQIKDRVDGVKAFTTRHQRSEFELNQQEETSTAPETLTFRERQRLFSLASSA
ncbi:Afadin [Liparis tanakae]|uniref:Afadin n=1 Tax=Liparis tanakae TaxID=230148 RepID=A0A4Z2IM00_9TELE|nr:Afadin [Liparis tanakae]